MNRTLRRREAGPTADGFPKEAPGCNGVLLGALIGVIVGVALLVFSPDAHAATPHAPARRYETTSYGSTYGTSPGERATICRPASMPGRRPMLVLLHGGGWVAGGRSAWADECLEMAGRGWFVANVDYVRGVQDGVPGDGKAIEGSVIAAVRHYGVDPHADPSRLVLEGDSAGGHLATLVGSYLHADGVVAWSPVAIPANAAEDGAAPGAPADVASLGARAQEFFGYSAKTASALAYPAIPMLLIGSADEWVDWDRQGGALCTALGPYCRSVVVPGDLHGIKVRDAHPDVAEMARRWATDVVS